jgi:hypothetical protein
MNVLFFNIRSMRWESFDSKLSKAIAEIYEEQPELQTLSLFSSLAAKARIEKLLRKRGLLQTA